MKEQLHFNEYQISDLVACLENEKIKKEMIELYEFKNFQAEDIVATFSDKSKIAILLENQYGFNKEELKNLTSKIGVDSLVHFIRGNKEFFVENNIKPYEITKRLNKESQLDFISKLENLDLSLREKRRILATLSKEAKNDIDTSKFSKEYVTAVEMQIGDKISDINIYGRIVIDYNKDLEIYRGLDEIISINPIEISNENKTKLLELCEICPQMKLNDNLGLSPSTAEEYRNGEIWIESVLQEINPQWSDIQKVAFIDHVIGNKISYSADFDTEVSDEGNTRALWKIINSGYGVCNGIAQVEKYILNKVGIEAEMVSSGRHSFFKLKDIEIPNAEDEVSKGNTILDPTWNLTAHRYGAKLENFCKSYEEIRKHDIRSDGKDVGCHRNDKDLTDATLELDEQSLRNIFNSIGLTDKDGNFPIKELIDKSKIIDDYKLTEEESIKRQLTLLADYCPEFATCQNSTLSILQGIVLNQENLKFNKCVASRVYERNDKSKRTVIYVYADLPEAGKKFYFADSGTRQFLELPQKEFEARFECYEMDMEKQGGHRPWEVSERIENLEDLTRNSGNVIASE